MASKTLTTDDVAQLSTYLRSTQNETPFSSLRDMVTKPLDASCTRRGSPAQTALGQLFSQESSDWFAKNQTSVMNAGEKALTQPTECYTRLESKSITTNVWYDDYVSDPTPGDPTDVMLEFMGFESKRQKEMREMLQKLYRKWFAILPTD